MAVIATVVTLFAGLTAPARQGAAAASDVSEAYAAFNRGDTAAARAKLENVLRHNGDSAPAHALLALVERAEGKPGAALREIGKAEKAKPDDSGVAYVHALLLADALDYKGARRKAEEAVAHAPTNSVAHLLLGDLALAADDRAAASREYAAAVANAGDNAGVADLARDCAEAVDLALREGVDTDQDDPKAAPGTKIKLLNRPRPEYSSEARDRHISGNVEVAVIFRANGQIGPAVVKKPLGYGLDEQALATVRQFKFVPAQRDGKPESRLLVVTVSFTTR